MFRKNHLSFLQGKQIKWDVLVTKMLKLLQGNCGRIDLRSLRVVIRDFNHFVIQINPSLLYFPIKSEKCGHLHVLQAYSDPISGSLFSVSPTVRPLVWSLRFTFKCWIKEHKHIERKKKKRKKQRWKCWVLSNSGWVSINAADLLRLFQTVKPVWTLTGMTSDSLKWRFGLPDYLTSQLTTLPNGQLSSNVVVNNSRQSKKKKREPLPLNLMTELQTQKFCWLHSATASCLSETLLRINSGEEKDIHSLRHILPLQWYSKQKDSFLQGAYFLGTGTQNKRGKYVSYITYVT